MKLSTEQKIGVGVAAATALAGIAAIFSSFGKDEEEEKPKRFEGFRSRRLGVKSCKPCDK